MKTIYSKKILQNLLADATVALFESDLVFIFSLNMQICHIYLPFLKYWSRYISKGRILSSSGFLAIAGLFLLWVFQVLSATIIKFSISIFIDFLTQ